MPRRKFLSLMLLSAVCAVAATPGFLLGVDYSQWLSPNTTKLATDNSGAIYVLTSFNFGSSTPPSTVTKLSADAKTILWQNQLTFPVSGMVVDPNGGVYVTPFNISGQTSVAKLDTNGVGVAWTLPVDLTLQIGFVPTIAVDSTGRVYLAAFSGGDAQLLRVSADGTAIDYRTHFQGMPSSVVVDASGAAFVAGAGSSSGGFLARFAPDGSAGFYSATANPGPVVALDSSGNAVGYSGGVIKRFDAAGNLKSSKTIATWIQNYAGLALDANDNAYVIGSTSGNMAYPVKNSLARCRSDLLTVAAPDGTILQTTYVPGVDHLSGPFLVNRDSSVILVASPGAGFVPTRTGPFTSGTGAAVLMRLALNSNAQPLSLVCAANGATYRTGRVSPGEIFILYGNGLGPDQGVEFRATVDRPYPTRLADAEVTFDGKQVPLIYAQDGQINLIAPWSLTPDHDTEVCISYQGVKGNCLTIPVVATDPGVFTVDGNYAIAFNEDGSVNSATNRAPGNGLVSIFATGLGPLTQPQEEGAIIGSTLPGNVLPVGAYALTFIPTGPFGSGIQKPVRLDVTFAGPALYHPVGVSQITFRVMTNTNPYYVTLPSTQTQTFSIYVATQ